MEICLPAAILPECVTFVCTPIIEQPQGLFTYLGYPSTYVPDRTMHIVVNTNTYTTNGRNTEMSFKSSISTASGCLGTRAALV